MGIGLHFAGEAIGVSPDRVAPKCLAFLKEALGNFHHRSPSELTFGEAYLHVSGRATVTDRHDASGGGGERIRSAVRGPHERGPQW